MSGTAAGMRRGGAPAARLPFCSRTQDGKGKPPADAIAAMVDGRPTDPGDFGAMELVTKAEKEVLEARLAALLANRSHIAEKIAEARAHGDLRENGDYHAAREQQGLEEAEIRRLQERLAAISVIDDKMAGAIKDTVFIGAFVKLREEGSGDEDMYKMVGEPSALPPADYVEVTATSPMGEALLKAKLGETVRVNAPRGMKRFTVVEIRT